MPWPAKSTHVHQSIMLSSDLLAESQGSTYEGISVVGKVKPYTIVGLFDAEYTNRTGRVAVLNTRMSWMYCVSRIFYSCSDIDVPMKSLSTKPFTAESSSVDSDPPCLLFRVPV